MSKWIKAAKETPDKEVPAAEPKTQETKTEKAPNKARSLMGKMYGETK